MDRRTYALLHKFCPECGSEDWHTTLAGTEAEQEEDMAYCDRCDWKGEVKDLKPMKCCLTCAIYLNKEEGKKDLKSSVVDFCWEEGCELEKRWVKKDE